MANNLSVDDLLAELDDLPHATSSTARKPAPSQRPSASVPSHVVSPPIDQHIRAMGGTHRPSPSADPPRNDLRHAKSANLAPRSSLDDLFDDFGDLPASSTTGQHGASPASGTRMAKSVSGTTSSTAAPTATSGSGPSSTSHSSPTHRPPAAKCRGLFLGGRDRQRGRNGSAVGSVHCCDHLRCTKCDFKVIWFFGKEWDSDVDYLFFR